MHCFVFLWFFLFAVMPQNENEQTKQQKKTHKINCKFMYELVISMLYDAHRTPTNNKNKTKKQQKKIQQKSLHVLHLSS